MYKRTIQCLEHPNHVVEAQFPNAAAFEKVRELKEIACGICGSTKVDVLPPSTRVNRGSEGNLKQVPKQLRSQLQQLREFWQALKANGEDVGDRFAKVARAIDEGKEEPRTIFGDANPQEVRELARDGVGFGIVPPLPKLDS